MLDFLKRKIFVSIANAFSHSHETTVRKVEIGFHLIYSPVGPLTSTCTCDMYDTFAFYRYSCITDRIYIENASWG